MNAIERIYSKRKIELGYVDDSPERLLALSDYLNKTGKK